MDCNVPPLMGGSPVLVRIDALRPADSPRLKGISVEHARLIADAADFVPPILVQRGTMRVIDGMHRVRAACLQGKQHVEAYLIPCDDDESFLWAVRMNLTHGLPLTLADRKSAACRIIQGHPEWSDRAIAAVAGLSDKTVGALRRRLADTIPRTRWRIGRDGRTRTLPVRGGDTDACRSRVPPLQKLQKDPSLRYTDAGRTMLRWLHTHPVIDDGPDVVAALPVHCLPTAAQVARQRAAEWADLARLLEERSRIRAS
jgi:ParB-like nuclease domain